MFRSLSGFRVSKQSLAAVLIFMLALVAGSSAHAQTTRRNGRDTNANRRARIAREVQETYTHRWEVGGGGGYLRFRPGESNQKNSEIAFWMNTTYYLNPKLGITGEIRGGYGNAKPLLGINNYPALTGDPQISEYPFMGGATYRLYRQQHYAVGVFALGGTAIGKFDGDTHGVPASEFGFWPSTSARPAYSVGANLDLNVYPNLAFRIAPSYLGTTFGGNYQSNFGFEMGLVFRFGRQK
jgi:hypothetical protein